jgi:hypothetical protein
MMIEVPIVIDCVQVSVAPVWQVASRSFKGFKQVRFAQAPTRGIELPLLPPPLVPPSETLPPMGRMPPVEEVPPAGGIQPPTGAPPGELAVLSVMPVAPPTEIAPAMELVVDEGALVAPPAVSTNGPAPPAPPLSEAGYGSKPDLLQAAVRAMKKRPTMTKLRMTTLLPPIPIVDEQVMILQPPRFSPWMD